jgi:6-phosphogluconolactonase (cycloisomerase 2 family)
VATHGNFVYVLNARDGGSLQGYLRVADFLIPTWHRDLNLDTTQTPEFTHTPGQVAFTPDGRQLIVTTKAASNAVEVFDVDLLGGIERNPTINTLPGAVPFAAAFDQRNHLAVTEVGPGLVASFDLNRRGELGTPLSAIPTTQAATCWITASGRFLFASNAGSATVTTVRPDGSITQTPTHGGTVDASASQDGRTLYVQTGATGTVDAYRINNDGSLTSTGSVVVPNAIGGEGIAAS